MTRPRIENSFLALVACSQPTVPLSRLKNACFLNFFPCLKRFLPVSSEISGLLFVCHLFRFSELRNKAWQLLFRCVLCKSKLFDMMSDTHKLQYRNNQQARNQGIEAPPAKFFTPLKKFVGHSLKMLGPSRKLFAPLVSQAGYGPGYKYNHWKILDWMLDF